MIRFIAICAATLSLTVMANVATSTSALALFGSSKQAISKACSKQADAKGLHGKARKAFRAKCKRHGGKTT
jgi:psiF repeat